MAKDSEPQLDDLEIDDLVESVQQQGAIVTDDETDQIGQTSTSTPMRARTRRSSGRRTRSLGSLLQSMNVYDGLLLASLICVVLACGLLFMELTSFGWTYQWRTTEALVAPISPP